MNKAELNLLIKRQVASVCQAVPIPVIASVILSLGATTNVVSAPLVISGNTHEHLVPAPNCPSQVGGITTGTGTGSMLGVVSLTATDCFTPFDNYFSFVGKMTFAGSNGDELFADYSGLLTPTLQPGIFALTDAVFTLTGGTGRFLYSSGSGTLQGSQNILTGFGSMQATGTIFDFGRGARNEGVGGPRQSNARLLSTEDTMSAYGWSGAAEAVELDSSLLAPLGTIGDYYPIQSQQLAVNAVPAAASSALMVIGLVSLAAIRRRKTLNSNRLLQDVA